MTEAQIQTKIKNRLTLRGWLVTKLVATSTNGWPDLLAIKGGRIVFIEVKKPDGRVSGVQQIRHKMLRNHGAEVFIMTDAIEVEAI